MSAESLYPALRLTSACNKRCDACLRPPKDRAHRLRWNDVQRYVDDLRTLGDKRRIAYQFVTGGEPTIWRDGKADIVDVLATLHSTGLIDTLVVASNGWPFQQPKGALDFVQRLSERLRGPLGIGVSVARFQENMRGGGCAELDNLLHACAQPGCRVVPIALVTLSVDDTTNEQLTARYPRVFQRVTALAPLGWGAALRDQCPGLSPVGNDKSSLGSFLPHFKRDCMSKLGLSASEFDDMPNEDIMNRLSLHNNCGRSPFVDSHWHYCLPLIDDERLVLFQIGHAKHGSLGDMIARHPLFLSIRQRGVIATLKIARDNLAQPHRERINALLAPEYRWPVAYRGCMVCKEMTMRVPLCELDSALERGSSVCVPGRTSE